MDEGDESREVSKAHSDEESQSAGEGQQILTLDSKLYRFQGLDNLNAKVEIRTRRNGLRGREPSACFAS